MKLAVFASHPVQYHAPLYLRLAQEAGLEVLVLFGRLPSKVEQGAGFGVDFSWDVPVLQGYSWKAAPEPRGCLRWAARELRAFEPDVVMLTGWHDAFLRGVWPLVVASRRRIVLRCEVLPLAERSGASRLLHRALFACVRRFAAIGSLNHSYYTACGVPQGRVTWSPYFSPLPVRPVEAAAKRALKEKFGLPADRTCFIFCGKLVEKKRPRDVFAAIRAGGLSERCSVLVVGAGALEGDLRVAAREVGVPTTFAGFVNQSSLPSAYEPGDCLVLPSGAGETWGVVVNEAMAAGMPAIVSDRVGCGPDLVKEGETGFVHPCGNVDALAARMRCIVEDTALAARMGENAARLVAADFTVEKAVAGLWQAVTEAAGCR